MVRSQSHPANPSNNDIGQLTFRLMQAIEKPVAFHRHVLALMQLQHYPRCDQFSFLGKDNGHTPSSKCAIPSWNSPQKFRMARLFIDYLRETRARACNGAKVTRFEQKFAKRASENGRPGTVRYKCAIVAYLHQYGSSHAFS